MTAASSTATTAGARTEIVPDDPALRVARRERVRAAMDEAGVDILVLGREANARYVSGAPRLWLAGTRPFGPGCVLVRETGAVYLLSTWDEGVPDDIPHEHLYGYTFNATNFIEVLKDVDGAATARTVATDALSPSAERLLGASFPVADLVDGDGLMGRVRRVKLLAEVDLLRASVGVAEQAVADAATVLAPGVSERALAGAFMGSMAAAGVTTPSTQDVVWVSDRERPMQRRHRDTPVGDGDLVAFEGGIIKDGYVGEVGRTHVGGADPSGLAALQDRGRSVWDRLVVACRPGEPVSGLLDAYAAAGEPLPPGPVARGLGLGYDEPLAIDGLQATAGRQLVEAGMVLALTVHVGEPGVGAWYVQEPVLVTDDGPEPLTAQPAWAR